MDWKNYSFDKPYIIGPKLYENQRLTLYLLEDKSTGEEFHLLYPKGTNLAKRLQDLIRFTKEAQSLQQLRHPNLLQIHDLGEKDEIPYLIIESQPLRTLNDLLTDKTTISFVRSIHMVIQICRAMEIAHSSGLYHLWLAPSFIRLATEEDEENPYQIKVEGFTLHNTRQYKLAHETDLEDFRYMAPEQLGLIKRGIDQRTDLFSLGVILYQMLIGELPFKGDSIQEFMHQQLTYQPDLNGENEKIPPAAKKILKKLLSIEPEKRYQSAKGLLEDLRRLMKGERDFKLAQSDINERMPLKTELIGREDEIKWLESSFKRAMQGKGNTLLLTAEAGQGKTRLIEEFRYRIQNLNTPFIEGKCYSGREKTPYGIFKEALARYVQLFSLYSEERKTAMRTHLHMQLGGMEALALKMLPELRILFGDISEVPHLAPEVENQRFRTLCARLICGIASKEEGMVLFLDDLHWADDGSIYLLEEIIRSDIPSPLFILGTYRNREFSGAPVYTLGHLALRGHDVNELHLKRLSKEKSHWLVARLLLSDLEQTEGIINLLYRKSKGNPLFLLEMLRDYRKEGALTFSAGYWQWVPEVLNRMTPSNNVVDIIIKNLEDLEEEEQQMLTRGSILTRPFSAQKLAQLSNVPLEKAVETIDKGIELQILEMDFLNRDLNRFSHDRIQEALYSKIPEDSLAKLHYEMALELEKEPLSDKDILFERAYHFKLSGDHSKILEHLLPAAQAAKEQFAQEEALDYYETVISSLEAMDMEGSTQWIDAKAQAGKISLWGANPSRAIEHYEEILRSEKDSITRGKYLRHISQAHLNCCHWNKSASYALEALKELKVNIPKAESAKGMMRNQRWLRYFQKITTWSVHSKKNDEMTREVIWLLYILNTSFSMEGDPRVGATVLMMINMAEKRLKAVKELGIAYQVYAVYLAEQPQFKQSNVYHQKSLELRQKINDTWGIVTSYLNLGFFYRGSGEFRKGVECFKKNVDYLKEVGFRNGLGPGLSGLAGSYIYLSEYNLAKRVNKEYLSFAEATNSNFSRILAWLHQMLILLEEGDLEQALKYGQKSYNLAQSEKSDYVVCMAATSFGRCLTERGETNRALQILSNAMKLYEENGNFLQEYTSPLFPFLLEAKLLSFQEQRANLSTAQQAKELKTLHGLAKKTLQRTKNWASERAYALRVIAQLYDESGNINKAETYFLRACNLSQSLERTFQEGQNLLYMGIFLEKRGKFQEARNSIRKAYGLFESINAQGYQRKAASFLGIDQDGSSQERFKRNLQYYQRLKSIIALSNQMSAILDKEELILYSMEKIMEITHAQGGWLLLGSEGESIGFGDHYGKRPGEKVLELQKEVLKRGQGQLNPHYPGEIAQGSVLAVPLTFKQEVQGVCYLENRLSSNLFQEEDQELLNILLSQLAVSIENAKLYKLAVTDGLTGLYNHRQLEILLQQEEDRASRYHRTFAIFMADIDYFKKINDQLGHQHGDVILQRIAGIIKKNCRSSDMVARYGGEEFALILPEIDTAGAQLVAEKLRSAIQKELAHEAEKGVTISLGIALYPHHGDNWREILDKADQALYKAKFSGRNQWALYQAKTD